MHSPLRCVIARVTARATRSGPSWSAGLAAAALLLQAAGCADVTEPAAGAPAALSIETQPVGSPVSGELLTVQPVVRVTDAAGRATAVSGVSVSVWITGGGALAGTVSVATVSGVATFADLRISGRIGTDPSLTFRAADFPLAVSHAVGAIASPGPAAELAVQVFAVGAAAGSAFGTQPVVELLDAAGNRATGTAGSVTIVAGDGAALVGSATAQAVAGLAAFSGVGLDAPGGNHFLHFHAAGLRSASQLVRIPAAGVWTGAGHTCGLTAAGVAYCWGEPHLVGPVVMTPTAVSGGHVFADLSAGVYHTCGTAGPVTAYCWGDNFFGQLGDSTVQSRSSPGPVDGGIGFAEVVAGYHTCGLTPAGQAYCWGPNFTGAVGDGTIVDRPAPAPVGTGAAFRSLAVGSYHTCGLTEAGAAHCWGSNRSGQLGDGTMTDRRTPVPVAGGHRWMALAAGRFHTCGLTAAGHAYCWGSGEHGRLGIGDLVPADTARTVAHPVAGGHVFAELGAGVLHTCALTAAGAAYCWGSNFSGQIGVDDAADALVPTQVGGGIAFAALATGGYHACGLTAAGQAYCWGQNLGGQLGTGDLENRYAPSPVSGGLTFRVP
jgi:hypothetical protein